MNNTNFLVYSSSADKQIFDFLSSLHDKNRPRATSLDTVCLLPSRSSPNLQQTRISSISKLLPCQKHTLLSGTRAAYFRIQQSPSQLNVSDCTHLLSSSPQIIRRQRTMKIARESDFDTTTKRYDYTQKKKRWLILGYF